MPLACSRPPLHRPTRLLAPPPSGPERRAPAAWVSKGGRGRALVPARRPPDLADLADLADLSDLADSPRLGIQAGRTRSCCMPLSSPSCTLSPTARSPRCTHTRASRSTRARRCPSSRRRPTSSTTWAATSCSRPSAAPRSGCGSQGSRPSPTPRARRTRARYTTPRTTCARLRTPSGDCTNRRGCVTSSRRPTRTAAASQRSCTGSTAAAPHRAPRTSKSGTASTPSCASTSRRAKRGQHRNHIEAATAFVRLVRGHICDHTHLTLVSPRRVLRNCASLIGTCTSSNGGGHIFGVMCACAAAVRPFVRALMRPHLLDLGRIANRVAH